MAQAWESEEIRRQGELYNQAKARGDKAGMEAARAEAERLRNLQGYKTEAQTGNLRFSAITSPIQAGYVQSSIIPLLDAPSKYITITSIAIVGIRYLTPAEIALLQILLLDTGFILRCNDATLNADINSK